MYSAKILADSLSPDDIRLTTFEVTLPRFLDAEFNTHRMISRNAASSRAIPTEKLIKRIRADPFIPEFNRRVKGMGVGEPLSDSEATHARVWWLGAMDESLKTAQALSHIDKSRVNRLLEPFSWHTIIATATDWANFFALRTAPDAQPEFRHIATLMKELYVAHKPVVLAHHQWHLPFVTEEERATEDADPKCLCAGRSARVSYLTHEGKRDYGADTRLYDSLVQSGHMSPLEHPARPFSQDEWTVIQSTQHFLQRTFGHLPVVDRLCRQAEYCGNFRGWHQHRYDIPNQHDFSLMQSV